MGGLAVGYHAAHQCIGAVCYMESPGGKACREACRAQDAHRVFRKGGGDVPQYAVVEIVETVVGVDEFIPGCFRHGVDGEVAAQQVFLEADVRVGTGLETGVTVTGLALGARQCVFLFRPGVQEYREILADGLVAQRQHGLR